MSIAIADRRLIAGTPLAISGISFRRWGHSGPVAIVAGEDGADAELIVLLRNNIRLLIQRIRELSPTPERLAEKLEHSRSCSAGYDLEADCTCGLTYRIQVQTEQNLRAAWEKRAYEAEQRIRDNRWIPVSERLPDAGSLNDVLLWADFGDNPMPPCVGFYCGKNGRGPDAVWNINGEYKTWPTHWRPLPSAPNEKSGE